MNGQYYSAWFYDLFIFVLNLEMFYEKNSLILSGKNFTVKGPHTL